MSTKSPKQSESNILSYLKILPRRQLVCKPNGTPFSVPQTILSKNVNLIDSNASQEAVFERVGAPAVHSALNGYNSTIIAYGQSGSGKTFTLTGGPTDYEDRGIIPRAISMLYNEYRNRSDLQLNIHVSFLELHNEKGYDLLEPAHDEKPREPRQTVSMMEDEQGAFHLTNLSVHSPKTEEEALTLLQMGDTNRNVGETPMNMASSRSHCIFTISLDMRVAGKKKVRRSKLQFVDLAATVSKDRSWALKPGAMRTETKHINSSICALHSVVAALDGKVKNGRTHIPYRNSMLTLVLRDSLGGNCKTFFIATIDPVDSYTKESLSTCKFAQRVSRIKNKTICNEKKLGRRMHRKTLKKKKCDNEVQQNCHEFIVKHNEVCEDDTHLCTEPVKTVAARFRSRDGADPCRIPVFADRLAAFEWFKAHYSLSASLDFHKAKLIETIEKAKYTEERMSRIRSVICYLTLSIEDLQSGSSSVPAHASLADGDGDNEIEATYLRTIQLERTSYKKNFDRQRALNLEIEVLQGMEENRVPMHRQFESWYADLQERDAYSAMLNAEF